MKPIVQILVLALITYGCAKQEQRQETSFTCSVEDITTGTMTEKAGIFLYEYHTPSAPFSSLSRNVVEYFEVDYGSSFSCEFNAKRGNGYEYVLEFKDASWFDSGYINNDGDFVESVRSCTLTKKEINECEFRIVPTAKVEIRADNPLGDANETDSIIIELFNDLTATGLQCSGIGSCPWSGGIIPHGDYNFRYKVFRNGVLNENIQYPLYIEHQLDTNIVIEF